MVGMLSVPGTICLFWIAHTFKIVLCNRGLPNCGTAWAERDEMALSNNIECFLISAINTTYELKLVSWKWAGRTTKQHEITHNVRVHLWRNSVKV